MACAVDSHSGPERHIGSTLPHHRLTVFLRVGFAGGACLALASCTGPQSALDPAGEEAKQVSTLFWVMAIGGLLIWAFMLTLSFLPRDGSGEASTSPRPAG